MKRLIAIAAVLALIFGAPLTVFANNADHRMASQFCTANYDFGLNHGKCVSTVVVCLNPGNTGPVCACKVFLHLDPEGFYEQYNNMGECINHLLNGYVFE